MGIPDHLTCLLRNLYAGQEATVRTGHRTTDWFQIGKGVCHGWSSSRWSRQCQGMIKPQECIKAVYCHPAHLTYMQSTSWEMLDWKKHKLDQDCWEKYQLPQIYRGHHPYGRKWRGTKSLLMKVKEESEKVGLKPNIQKTKIVASGPITSWEVDGETVETVSDFIFWGSKITADGDCSHEIRRRLLLGRKVLTNLDSIFKSRDITLPRKVRLVKAMVFPVVMYGCEIWTMKKAERQRIDAFELWCWRRLLRVPWTARRSNQSILKEISPGCSLEGC